VTDPSGVVWSGCGTPAGCRALNASSVPPIVRGAPLSASQQRAGSVGGAGTAPLVRSVERVERASGAWTITRVASTAAIMRREQSVLLRLLATALATAIAVAGVGLLILRQQRRAFALEVRLQRAQTLAAARETSEAIVDNAPLGVLGVSLDGRVALANRYLAARLGPIKVGAPLREAFRGDGAAWIRDLVPLLIEKPSPDGPSVRELRAATAVPPSFDVRIVPVRDPALGVRTFALFEDRSTIRDLENQLVRAEKLITVGVLSAGIAHEIGTPLAVIRGLAEQVLRKLEGAAAEDLRVVIKHIDQIAKTIRQLLDFSRTQAIEQRAVGLDAVVRRAVELLQWKLEAKSLRVEIAVAPDLPALAADPDQLEQVLVNLLLNACDASANGGLIRVAARAKDAELVAIEIADQGHGIAPEHLHSVFDPFFTTKKRGEGTGLGLSIVSSIVRNHGGKIDLASIHGKGTTVAVVWPAVPEKEPRA